MGATRQTALQVVRAAGSDQAASLLIKAGARSFRMDSDSDSDAAGSDDDSDDVPKMMVSASEPAPQGKAVAAGTAPPPGASRPRLLKSLSKYSSRVEVAPEELPPVSPQSASVPSTPRPRPQTYSNLVVLSTPMLLAAFLRPGPSIRAM